MESLAILIKESLKMWCPLIMAIMLINISISMDEISKNLSEISAQECVFKE